jgi:hypothetical protein
LAGAETGLPQRPDHGFSIILGGGSFRGRGDHQCYFPAWLGIRGPLNQGAERACAHFLMDLGQFAGHHDWPITKNFHEVLQGPPETLRRFKYNQWESSDRGPGN